MNALLNAEAGRLCNAQRHERTEARRGTRAGHSERKLQTKAGNVALRIPKRCRRDSAISAKFTPCARNLPGVQPFTLLAAPSNRSGGFKREQVCPPESAANPNIDPA